MKKILSLFLLGFTMILSAQNILENGSFENWTDGKPDHWFGTKTNISSANVLESSDAQDGAKSVNLINDASGHKRFTSQGYNLNPNSSYTLTFYVKGVGEVRNAWFNGNTESSGGGFSTYSEYTAAGSSWQQITYVFETAEDVTGAEIIFSLRNTDAAGILIDNAVLIEGGVVEVTDVATIAELRAQTPGSAVYRLTGEALLTFKIANRHQKYIEDGSAGILIDDVAARLGDDYEIGDKIANITGTLNVYNQLIQFIPTEAGTAAVSSGNPVNYQVVSLGDYLANPTNYESEYIAISNLTISDYPEGDGTFQNGQSYPMTDGSQTVEGRTQFYDLPFIGTNIPTVPVTALGFGGRFNETIQVFLADVINNLGTSDLNSNPVSMNSVWNQTVHFNTNGKVVVEIYNLNGQLVQRANGENSFNVNVSGLNKGVYVVKISVDGKTSIHKAIKK